MTRRKVGILVFPEVEVLDFCGPFEVFSVTRLDEDRRRQDHWQAHTGFYDHFPALFCIGEPVTERDADDQQDDRRGERQFHTKPEGLPIDHGVNVYFCVYFLAFIFAGRSRNF